jgi:hypothetical protein
LRKAAEDTGDDASIVQVSGQWQINVSQVQVKLTAGLLLMARGTAPQSVILLDDVLMEGMSRYDQGRKVEGARRRVVEELCRGRMITVEGTYSRSDWTVHHWGSVLNHRNRTPDGRSN